MMGFPFGWSPDSFTCDNCGHKLEKAGVECRKCGYIKPKSKELEPASLVYCEGCGCTYLQYVESASVCNIHPKEKQKKVKT